MNEKISARPAAALFLFVGFGCFAVDVFCHKFSLLQRAAFH